MDVLSERELAERSGVAVEDVRRFVDLGILAPGEGEQPFRTGDIRRVRLAKACEDAGLPLDGIGAAISAGKLSFAFLDLPSYRWTGLSTKTYRLLSDETGIPMTLLQGIHEAMGLPSPRPEDLVPENDLDMVPSLQVSLASGVEEAVLLRMARVLGESLGRIAQAEAGVYHSQIEMPLLRSGMSQRQMMELASQFGLQIVPVQDRLILAGYHRMQEHAWIEDLIEHVEAALAEAGVHRKLARPPAMCFLDLAGYTRLTEERGDEAAAELAASLASLVQRVSQRRGGRPVKWLGDGVMFHFKDPSGAVVSALEMVERTPAAGLPPAHVGLHAGPVVMQDGDYFGRTVNIAARIAAKAGPGEVLVSDEVVETSKAHGVRFEEVGRVELKGVSRPVTLHQAFRAG